MSVAIEREQVVAGFINVKTDGLEFSIEDVEKYITSLWNAGCGPIRRNFRQGELIDYLDRCEGICLRRIGFGRWCIDKSFLSDEMTPQEREFFHGDPKKAKSFDLFCRLQVDIRTPNYILKAMGFGFLCD